MAGWDSASAAELDDPASITFRRSRCGQLFELSHRFALGRDFLAQFPAGVCLAVEGLCNRSGTAGLAEKKDFDFEVAAVVGHVQYISDANFACGFRGLLAGLNSAEFTRSRGE